ncbi:A alpha-helical domain with a conserved ER moti [Brevundimonas sp. GN22]|uniref:alpha-E domain-containing protein n=1 Tax=Brevundimonas pishanensis TaxID=2896315 RepID=UPI001FA7B571|nr:alpha-E domain-containing protein [Brevundimonas pishanensis]
MLSRTADSLYWAGRYIERADYLARILEATLRLAAIPTKQGTESSIWAASLATSGCPLLPNSDLTDPQDIRDYLAFSPDNPSSIHCCLTMARTNARSVRTALTVELWETINGAWNRLQELDMPLRGDELLEFLQWVKGVTLGVEGATSRTMLRNDAYWFLRLGAAVERADNTARLLDVKYHLLLPEGERVGGQFDYFQWTTLLREVSALTAYRWVYRDDVKPWHVADLMILNRQMPRSLASCQATIVRYLDRLAADYDNRGPAQRLASAQMKHFEGAKMDTIFQSGLHEYIQSYLAENRRLGEAIHQQYLS